MTFKRLECDSEAPSCIDHQGARPTFPVGCRHSNGTCDDSSIFLRVDFHLLLSLPSVPAHRYANAWQAKSAAKSFPPWALPRGLRTAEARRQPGGIKDRLRRRTTAWLRVCFLLPPPSARPFNLLTPDACSAQWITRTRLAQGARGARCSRRRRRLLLPPPDPAC